MVSFNRFIIADVHDLSSSTDLVEFGSLCAYTPRQAYNRAVQHENMIRLLNKQAPIGLYKDPRIEGDGTIHDTTTSMKYVHFHFGTRTVLKDNRLTENRQ